MDTITTRFIDEWFVSYHLTWHISLNKTHCYDKMVVLCKDCHVILRITWSVKVLE